MLAYNVAPYVGAAIEGVLGQEAPFPIELVIGKDKSTDDTLAICSSYARQYPKIIRILPQLENQGIAGNARRTLSHCSGKYIAICDGDDIWTDPHKIREQVRFLEEHPDYGMSYTDVQIISETGAPVQDAEQDAVRPYYAEGHVFLKLLDGNFIANSTAVFRRELLQDHVIDTDRQYYIHDYLMWLHVSMRSKVHFYHAPTTAYRKHSGGVTNSEIKRRYNRLKLQHALFQLLTDFDRINTQPLSLAEKTLLFRKILSSLYRKAGTWQQKLNILPLALKYMPGPAAIGSMVLHKLKNLFHIPATNLSQI